MIALHLLSIYWVSHVEAEVLPTAKRKKANVLLICVDDLRPELACYGKEYIHSPNIDRLAESGRLFRRHYVQAPTCGASRYTMLTGQYGSPGNDALFVRARKPSLPSMPVVSTTRLHRFCRQGFSPSRRPGWADGMMMTKLRCPVLGHDTFSFRTLATSAWRVHGLANGEIRVKAGEMNVYQSVQGGMKLSDGYTVDEALRQLDQLTANTTTPFFLAVGTPPISRRSSQVHEALCWC